MGEFKQAADLAPQWPEARYNLALAKEAAGDYSGAMDDLKLYQQFKLSNDEARTVQDKIYALEAKQAKAAEAKAKESSPEAVAAKQQDEYDAWLKKLDGAKFSYTRSCNVGTEAATGSPVIAQTLNLVIRGKHVISSSAMICANGHHLESGPWAEPFEFEGNTFIQQAAPGYKNNVFTISDDGAFITYFMPSMRDKWVFTRQ